MGVMKLTPGQNPDASGVLSYGTEGDSPGFQVTTEGGITANGDVTIAGTLTVGGSPITGGGSGSGYYPPDGYNCFAISAAPEACPGQGIGTGDFFTARIYVPANKAIVAAGAVVNVAATYDGSSTQNRMLVYSDDGLTLLGSSPDDSTLWTSTGWRFGVLSVPIAAQSSGYWVRVGGLIAGMTGGQWALSPGSNLQNVINGGRSGGNTRATYHGGITTPPATLTIAADKTGYVPLIGLADA
jgi:hypothetical protein